MLRTTVFTVLAFLAALPRCLADSDPLPQSIAPFINDDTFLVIDFDLSHLTLLPARSNGSNRSPPAPSSRKDRDGGL